jgi:PAS domain S-box-containing protein
MNKRVYPTRFIPGFMRKYHFWVIVALFTIIIVLHYPQQLHLWAIDAFSSHMGLTRHAVERVFLLIPVMYTGYIFGVWAGVGSLAIAVLIMLPRTLFISSTPADATFETLFVIVAGGIANVWLYVYHNTLSQRHRVEEMLSNIINSSSIPSFVIDKNHKVTHWNTAIEALYGVKKEEMIGTSDQWRAFYGKKRPTMADMMVDGATQEEIESYYAELFKKSNLIEGAYEAEQFFSALGRNGMWLHFTASPLKDKNGEIIGAIETLSDISERIEAEKNLQNYLKEITRAQEEERKRIARELHDDTAQNLIALLHQLENLLNEKNNMPMKEAQALWGIYERIRDILHEVRHFSRDLRPSIIDDLGLLPALEWVTDEIKRTYWVDVTLTISGDERRLLPEAELLLFRVVQEALRNIARHARATKSDVIVEFHKNKITLTVKDDGIGFQPPENLGALPHMGKLGIIGMQERVKLMDGSLLLESSPGKGTKVMVEVPI